MEEECLKVAQPQSHLQTCVLMSIVWGGTATIAILNRECVLMSMLGGGATTISTLKRGCAHVNAWRWHSDNLHLELCVCACVTAYTTCAHVNVWR